MSAPTVRVNPVEIAPPRGVRLRAEFAGDYPELKADTWMWSRELAERLVKRSHDRKRQGLFTRTFDPRHFQFRDGDSHAARPAVSH